LGIPRRFGVAQEAADLTAVAIGVGFFHIGVVGLLSCVNPVVGMISFTLSYTVGIGFLTRPLRRLMGVVDRFTSWMYSLF
jgi:nucleoside permease NupC